jgi:hypothetical protein
VSVAEADVPAAPPSGAWVIKASTHGLALVFNVLLVHVWTTTNLLSSSTVIRTWQLL